MHSDKEDRPASLLRRAISVGGRRPSYTPGPNRSWSTSPRPVQIAALVSSVCVRLARQLKGRPPLSDKGRGVSMAIGVMFDGPGVTQAQYEQALKEVAPDNKRLPGMIF